MEVRKNYFINISNHPSKNWDNKQLQCALDTAPNTEIVDIGFPAVDSNADEEEIKDIAVKLVDIIAAYNPAAVMCQGEFGLTYCIVTKLKKKGIKVVYSCSERKTIERQTENGTEKLSVFHFVKFRSY